MKKRILSMLLILALCLTMLPSPSGFAAGTVIYVAESGDDANAGTAESPCRTLPGALALANDGDSIEIVGSVSVAVRTDSGDPLYIDKAVTIRGADSGVLYIDHAGILLGADVTFRDLTIYLQQGIRNAILANGHTLTIENVRSDGHLLHLFCGSMTGYEGYTVPSSGEQGRIIVSGTNTLGNLYAGSFAQRTDITDENGDAVYQPGAANEFSGSAEIVFAAGAGGTIGSVYACGATEAAGTDADGMTADSANYVVSGTVSIQLSGSKPAAVYGAAGAGSNASVTYTGDTNLCDNLNLVDISALTVATGRLKPATLTGELSLGVCGGAELDLSAVIEDGTVYAVKDFTGGGMLALGQTDALQITGNVTGVTQLQTTTTSRPNDTATSGEVTDGHAYVIVTNAAGDGTFTFTPCSYQNASLTKITQGGVTAWTAQVEESDAYAIKPVSFSIAESAVEYNEQGMELPVSYELDGEYDYLGGVSFRIAVSKDGETPVNADEAYDEDMYCYSYSVASLGFAGISISDDTGSGVLTMSFSDEIAPGNYVVSITTNLIDGSTVTEEVSFTVPAEAAYDGPLLFDAATGTITGCDKTVTEVVIPETINGVAVTAIEEEAFAYCMSLTSVTIPGSVTSIGDGAFGWCDQLKSISVEESNPVYCDVDGALYTKDKGILLGYPVGRAGESFTVPDGVRVIGTYAFFGCDQLTAVTIPDSVVSIEDFAFANCGSLTDVYYSGTEEQWNAIMIGNQNHGLSCAAIHFGVIDLAAPEVRLEVDPATGKLLLVWEIVDGAEEYEIWRSEGDGRFFEEYAVTQGNCFLDTAAEPGVSYGYQVRAAAGKNESPYSNTVCIHTIRDCGAHVVMLELNHEDRPELTWAKVAGASVYEIWRAVGKNGEFAYYDSTTDTRYTDFAADAGMTYAYRVKAICGDRGVFSNIARVTVPAKEPRGNICV